MYHAPSTLSHRRTATGCEATRKFRCTKLIRQSVPGSKASSALGLDELGAAAGRGRPIVAIGGIAATNVKELIEAGAWGFAIKSGVWEAEDPGEAARMYVDALEAALGFDAVDGDE